LFRNSQATSPEAQPDGLDAFAAERDAAAPRPAEPPAHSRHRWIIAALAVIALVEAPVAGLWLYEWTRHDQRTIAPVAPQPPIHSAVPLVVPPPVPQSTEPGVNDGGAIANAPAMSRVTTGESERAPSPLTVGGWVSMKTPVPMQVFEEGRLVGTTDVDRLMLTVGTHRLEIVSETLGYRSRQEVAIRAGQTSTLRLEMPTAALAVNAQPWAEVWIDGERVGETPIGNLTRTIGPHEVVFRHPDLGEKKTTVVVTLKEPARVGVDLRSK
jgi:hypothetical protein